MLELDAGGVEAVDGEVDVDGAEAAWGGVLEVLPCLTTTGAGTTIGTTGVFAGFLEIALPTELLAMTA